MEDRVAEVLAQRAALDRGPVPAVLLSIALHGSLIGAGAWMAMRTPPRQAATPMIDIRLASPPPTVAPAPMKPVAPELEKPVQPRIEAPKPVADTPPPPVPEKHTVPLSPFGKSTKKGSEAAPVLPAPAPQQPSAPATTTAPNIQPGGSGVVGIEGDFPFPNYLEQMQRNIGRNWLRPLIHPPIEATIYFRIERDGTIREAKVVKPSASGVFDRNALRAVLASSPLPPLPYAYKGTYLGVHLNFQ